MDVSLVKTNNTNVKLSGDSETKAIIIKTLLDIMKSASKEIIPMIKKEVIDKYEGSTVIDSAQAMITDLDKYSKEHNLTFEQRMLVEERKEALLKLIAKEYRFKHAAKVVALAAAMGLVGLLAYVAKTVIED